MESREVHQHEVILTPQEKLFFDLFNKYNSRDNDISVKPVSSLNGLVSDVVVTDYKSGTVDTPQIRQSISDNIRLVEDLEGSRLIEVGEGYGVSVLLDDSTAFFTYGLHDCFGLALLRQKNRNDNSNRQSLAVAHFQSTNGINAMKQYIDLLTKTNNPIGAVICADNNSVGAIRVEREFLGFQEKGIQEVVKPFEHSEFIPAGFIVTNKGGIYIEAELDDFKAYHPRSTWKWK